MARVALLQDIVIEYMGYMCLSAVLKQAGHEVEVFIDEQTNRTRFISEVAAFRPDVICFSLLTPSVPWALRLAPMLKDATNAVVIAGNVHVAMCPEIVEEPGIDIACLGEGEMPMLQLCAAIDAGASIADIPGVWVKTAEGIQKNPKLEDTVDMDAAPYLDRPLYNKYRYFRSAFTLRIMLGRGCPFRCSFCSNPVMMDKLGGMRKFVRKRSPENAVAEIEHLIRNHTRKVRYIQFTDEVFWVRNDWLREFLVLYKERIGLPFKANFRFGGLTEEDVKLIAWAGGQSFLLAVETADEEQRRGLMNKPVTNEQILRLAEWMHKYRISFGASSFFGLPGRDAEAHRKQLSFYRQIRPKYLWTTFFQPYPGLALTSHPEMKPLLPEGRDFNSYMFYQELYLNLPDAVRLTNLRKAYFFMMKYPRLEGPLYWMTQFKIPVFFDLLFLFGYCTSFILWWDKLSLYQWFYNFKLFLLNPVLRRTQPTQGTGRPFQPKIRGSRLVVAEGQRQG